MTAQDPDVWHMLYTDAGEFNLPVEYVDRARQAGIEIDFLDDHDPAKIAAYGERCNGLFLYRARIDEAVLAALPQCRLLARVGTGYDLIDVEAARSRGIMVLYVPDFCTEELSDHVMAFILGFARRFPFILHEHHWLRAEEVPVMHRLAGQTLGILGFGRSGQRTAEKARAFGMEVLAWSRTPRPEALARVGARAATFEEVLRCAYVSLHLPLTEATRGMIDAEVLAKINPEAVLINIARGAIVDTDALVDALRAGKLAGAGLDVVQPSPLPADHPLWSFPNVWITPHSGAFSVEGKYEALSTIMDDVIRVRQGERPLNPVPELQGMVLGDRAPGR